MSPDEAIAEAKRRIAEARESDAELLFLGDLGLTRVPSEIGQLTSLRHMGLGSNKPVLEDGIVGWEYFFDVDTKALEDLAPLATLANLQSLVLSGCTGVSDVSPLAGLANLQSLVLSDCQGG